MTTDTALALNSNLFLQNTIFACMASIILLNLSPTNSSGQEQKTETAQDIDFAHDIVPIFKKHCAKCHSNGTYKGGMSLDTRTSLLKSGTIALRNAEESELVRRILSKDDDDRMPPEGKPLSEDEVQTIKRWINTGANWEAGFTFKKKTWKAPLAPRKVEIPSTDQNPIDYLVDQYFQNRKIAWPRQSDDATFARRVWMDLIGLLPTRSELQLFLSDKSSMKRQELIDRLLERKRDYADHWLTFWNDHLRNDYVGTGYIDGGRKQITGWLYRSLYDNKPYNQFARELIAPQPESEGFIRGIKWRGNVNASQVRELQFAQSVSQVFLGENLKCASCHDSFINDWKLDDAYGMAAVMSDKPLEAFRCDKPTGELVGPKFLWPQLGTIDPKLDQSARLSQLASLVVKKENGRFTRTIVNRIWKRMMGRGLVEPVDIMGNRPWNEDLLDFLAYDLQENGFDLKRTMALIARSKIYQSQSVSIASNADEDSFVFRGPIVRRMTAEQFLDAVWQITEGAPASRKGPIPNLASASTQKKNQKPELLANWIWDQADATSVPGNKRVEFESSMMLKNVPQKGFVVITCDNEYTVYVNQKKIRNDTEWNTVELLDIRSALKKGKNSIYVSAKNHAETPNPAGLYVSVILDRKLIDLNWEIRKKNNLQRAVEIRQPEIWAGAFPQIRAKEQQVLNNQAPSRTRASHVIADSLMRSLGRPNREQIVTTRDDQLSTLQALDLSNGLVFSKILAEGGKRLVSRYKNRDEIIKHVYRQGLSRNPTRDEIRILQNIIGESPKPDSVADLIWSVVMLPEFQHVR